MRRKPGATDDDPGGVLSPMPTPLRRPLLLAAAAVCSLVLLAAALAPATGGSDVQWSQWGGPGRDFKLEDAPDLADSWPETGPPLLWSRPLGEGHSAIVYDDGRLYTLYRPTAGIPDGEHAAEEVVLAMRAEDGETIWEYRYPSEPMNFRFGAGPHATPLVVGERVFTTGTNKQLHAFDKRSGRLLWNHDLVADFGAPPTLVRPAVKAGYAVSPLAWKDTLVTTAGGEGQSVMAFRQDDGAVVWRSGDFLISPASPILIEVGGEAQLVIFGGQTINGLDPDTGEILWSHAHDTTGDMNNSTPIWGADGLLFVSSSYDGGSRVLRLTAREEDTGVEELWFSERLRVMIGTAIRQGDMVLGNSGVFGPQLVTALDIHSGEVLWRHRGFARATFLWADGKLIVLDEDGVLALARATRDGLDVLSRYELFDTVSWTVPTLVGTTLYARDRDKVVALDLSPRR